jgi:hypothetical protein
VVPALELAPEFYERVGGELGGCQVGEHRPQLACLRGEQRHRVDLAQTVSDRGLDAGQERLGAVPQVTEAGAVGGGPRGVFGQH